VIVKIGFEYLPHHCKEECLPFSVDVLQHFLASFGHMTSYWVDRMGFSQHSILRLVSLPLLSIY